MGGRKVFITGAGGYLGRQLVAALAARPRLAGKIVASDLHLPPAEQRLEGVTYITADVRDPKLADILRAHDIDAVAHLAAVVTPGRKADRGLLHQVEVEGTRNLLEACLAAGVAQFIVTSSGAAYGYHADNPSWLEEKHPLRGNREFTYSDHKRQVEEMLAQWRDRHPQLRQLVLRPGTILGQTTDNQITRLFDGRLVLGIAGASSPFVFIWDQDVVAVIIKGLEQNAAGIYNLAGDGTLTMAEIAGLMGKPYLPLPAWLVKGALWLASRLGLSPYGPEQVGFLRYRPVLCNRRLKEQFGYQPQKTTRQVFDLFREARGHGH